MQHVATWREGDEKWAYHPDAFANIATHKVSLDPYRLESRRILACIKDTLPAPPIQRVEKASVDEVFLDLSAQIYALLVEKYPELSGPAPYDDPTELLPKPPSTALDWNTDALVDLDSSETEDDDPDWDDIAMLIGSEIVRSVRASIRKNLKYTCSAGIGRNKMIAKLGSAHKKPNQQTIVRNRAIQHFLSGFKFTKIRNLGGKLGEEVVSKFGTEEVVALLSIPLEQLKTKIGDDSGSWVYEVIRGNDFNEVNSRTQIKSMLSAKSFRPAINSFEQGLRWIRIFVSDIFSRLVEEGVLVNKRRPKTINLHHRQGGQMRSRQAPLPTGRSIDEALLFDTAKSLLGQIVVDGRAWPCSNLQLSVGGFENGPIRNRGIGSFLVRGEEAKEMKSTSWDVDSHDASYEKSRLEKRRRVGGGSIQRFLTLKDPSNEEKGEGLSSDVQIQKAHGDFPSDQKYDMEALDGEVTEVDRELIYNHENLTEKPVDISSPPTTATPPPLQLSAALFRCSSCGKCIPQNGKEEHEDWHFAKSLEAGEHSDAQPSRAHVSMVQASRSKSDRGTSADFSVMKGRNKARYAPGLKKSEKGQSRLVFGP